MWARGFPVLHALFAWMVGGFSRIGIRRILTSMMHLIKTLSLSCCPNIHRGKVLDSVNVVPTVAQRIGQINFRASSKKTTRAKTSPLSCLRGISTCRLDFPFSHTSMFTTHVCDRQLCVIHWPCRPVRGVLAVCTASGAAVPRWFATSSSQHYRSSALSLLLIRYTFKLVMVSCFRISTQNVMTHSDEVNQRQSAAWTYGHESKGHNPAKKESVKTVVPCALGKVCNWDTVVDSVPSHKKGTKNTQPVAETNSNEFGRQRES